MKSFEQLEREALEEGQEWTRKRIQEKIKQEQEEAQKKNRLSDGLFPLGQPRLIHRQRRTIAIQTCAGIIKIETLYGQDRQTGQWRYPLKEQLGICGRLPLSPLLAQRLCFTATQSLSFAACARTATIWGVPVNDSMVHRYVQEHGARVARQRELETERILDPATRQEALAELEDEQREGLPFRWLGRMRRICDSLRILRVSVAQQRDMLDGWMIRERGAQWGLKPPETKADRVDWREMKTGIVFRLSDRAETQSGRRMLVEKFYEAWRGEPYEFGRRLFALALRHGLRRARRVYVIADGAVWIWNLAQDRFHDAVQVLDFYHAAQHLWAVAEALFPDDPQRARQWWELRKKRLREKGAIQVDRILDELTRQAKKLKGAQAEVVEKERGYFKRNRARMNYPQSERQNAPIGSGAIESTCSQMQDRLKRTGQFWTKKGCRNFVALDLVSRNNDWDRIWHKCAA